MRQDGDEPNAGAEPEAGMPPPLRRWQALRGGGAPNMDAEVRLWREFKGVSVDELLQQEELLQRLPGRARSALAALRRGDVAGAEAELPGSFLGAARIVPGPGHHRERRAATLRLLVFVLTTGMLAALLLVFG